LIIFLNVFYRKYLVKLLHSELLAFEMRIFLIGMMGSGKTTLGKQLAERLHLPFVDLDEFIERREKCTIAELFEQIGPDKFREAEQQALQYVVKELKEVVVATGGGTPCFYDNMEFINKYGESIYLNVEEEEIFKRLYATDLTTRPLLKEKSVEELKSFIHKTLEQRKSFYKQARYTVEGGNTSPNDLLKLLNYK
jgi:shikimate kinase